MFHPVTHRVTHLSANMSVGLVVGVGVGTGLGPRLTLCRYGSFFICESVCLSLYLVYELIFKLMSMYNLEKRGDHNVF